MSEQDATQQPSGVSKREADMDALIKAREEEKANDNQEAVVEPALSLPPEHEEAFEPTPVIKFTGEDGKEYEVPLTAKALLKIDGEEIETPIDQMSRRYQKGAAGDKRLEEANRIARELDAKANDLTRKEKEILQRVSDLNQQKQQGDLSPDGQKAELKDLVSALIEADEDRVMELLPKMLSKSPPPAPTIDVDQVVESKLSEREWARNLERARSDFSSQYADLANDPMLFDMVNNKTGEIYRMKPKADPWAIVSEAAETVKAWRDDIIKANRQVRKKPSVPTPVGGRASIGTDPPPLKTRTEVLNEMRIARGQPAR